MIRPSILIFILFFYFWSMVGFADSTALKPLSAPMIAYPSSTSSPPLTITQENYQSLPVCNTINLAYCPTINNISPTLLKLSGTQMSNACPNYCTVTRTLTESTGTSWTTTTNTVDAVCPAGYASVAQFNMQPEYVNYTTATDISPLIGLSTYTFYNSHGLYCDVVGTSTAVKSSCKGSSQYSTGQILDTMTGATPTGVVVKVVNTAKNCYTTGSGCSSSFSISCKNLAYDAQYTYWYQPMGCVAVGMTPTSYMVPTTLVCARVTPQWKTL